MEDGDTVDYNWSSILILVNSCPHWEKIEKLLESTVLRAPGSPGALIQMQIKRSIFKIYHLGTPCFRNDLCPIASNMRPNTRKKNNLTSSGVKCSFP